MTSSSSQEDVIDLNNLESLAEEVFTRTHTHEINQKILQAVAAEVFYGKTIRANMLDEGMVRLREIVETIALVIGKTYVSRGDSYSLADDEALTLISDLLIIYDPTIITRNMAKRIPKHLRR